MIVLKHLLMIPQVYKEASKGSIRVLSLTELIVVLSELAIADGAVLINDAPDLHGSAHARGVPTKLNHLDFPL
jgi:hypothetical protein